MCVYMYIYMCVCIYVYIYVSDPVTGPVWLRGWVEV